jgi:hypothetical protein
MKQEGKNPVTLEDLLRLKRAERPAAEFWDRFDRELRTKQLAALVERTPWWKRLPQLASVFLRPLPLGAAAVLALSFVTLREYRAPAPVSTPVAATAVVPAEEVAATTSIHIEPVAPLVADAAVLPVYDTRPEEVPATVALNETETAVPADPSVRRVSLLGSVAEAQVAANLAAVQAAEPAITRSLLGGTRGFETRALPARSPTVDPLAQMTHPSEARRARIQSAMAMMSSLELPSRTATRVTSQISNDRLYDQNHRLEGSGNQLSFKF